MMIVPIVHVPNLVQIEEDTLSEMMLLTKDATQVLADVYEAESYNIGVNIGEAAGAGVAEHIHIHVVPRWHGDTNFMSTTANTRVIPEELEKTYSRLRAAWQNKSA